MKIRKKTAVSAAVTLLTAGLSTLSVFTLKKIDCIKRGVRLMPSGFTITAHAGANNTKPNTSASLAAAFNSNADTVEFDLNFTSDGTPVLSHDAPKDGCFSLREAFAFAAKHTDKTINIDVKAVGNIEKIPPLADEYGITENIFFTGIEMKDIASVREKTPCIPYWLNFKPDRTRLNNEKYILSIVENVKNAGAVGLNVKYCYASETMIRIFHENDLLVSLWTANTIPQLLRTMSLAPDNITTKRPDLLKGLIYAFSQ